MPGLAAQRDLQLMQSGFAQLGAAMRKQKEDQLYNRIMDSLEPGVKHTGGRTEYALFQQQAEDKRDIERDRLDNLIRQAQLHNAVKSPAPHSNYSGANGADYRRDILNEQDRAEAALQDFASRIGKEPKDARSEMSKLDSYITGQTPFPALGEHPQITDASEGVYKDDVLRAHKAYRDALGRLSSANYQQPLAQQPSTQPSATPYTDKMSAPADDPYSKARDAVKRGARVEDVKKRLAEAGYNPDLL